MLIFVCNLWELTCLVCRGAWGVGYKEGGVAWNAGGTCWLVVGSVGGGPAGFVCRFLIRISTPVSRIFHLLKFTHWLLWALVFFLCSYLSPDYSAFPILSMFWVWRDGYGPLQQPLHKAGEAEGSLYSYFSQWEKL